MTNDVMRLEVTSAPPDSNEIPSPDPEEAVEVLIDPLSDEVLTIEPTASPVAKELHISGDDSDDDVTAKLRSQGVRIGRFGLAPAVFWPALIVILAVVISSIAAPEWTGALFGDVQDWIVSNLGWYYVLLVAFFVLFVIVLAASPLGRIKLGRDDEEPEFGVLSWFSMLFAAGMGIGLVFYGVGEPLIYATVQPKPGWDGSQEEIAGLAMAQTFVHWGLHPWAIYAVIGLAIAFAVHRRGRPVSIRWALEPLLGDRVKGWAGDLIDVLAIFGTLFGIATSLGFGVQQIAAGLSAIGIVDTADTTLLIILIVVITFIATFSVASGIGAGMKWLSNINLSLAGIFMIAVMLLGPTLFLLENFVQSLGFYLANVLQLSFDTGAFHGEAGHEWFSNWSIFYWGWWISWAPFVGIFIARISRGRTVRQFIIGVLLVPSLVGFIWFGVMGGSGLHRQLFGEGDLVENGAVEVENALFGVLSGLPGSQILSVVAILLVAIFFVTSSDSGSLVIDMLASGGHPNPPTWSRVLWSFAEGATAIALLLAGGLATLRAASLATALPFSVVLLLMCVASWRGLRHESRKATFDQRVEVLDRTTSLIAEQLLEGEQEKHELRSYIDDRIDYRVSQTQGVWRGPRG